MKKRKIIAVTGARSEYDILFPILNILDKDITIDLSVLVTGAHLSEKYGLTLKQVENDGFRICDKVYNLIDSDNRIGRVISLGNQIPAFAQTFQREMPDIVLIVGDREEAISTSITCAYMDIVCAHIAGGDIAKDGNIDNSVRYATSKFAHVHFTILPEHKKNLIRLGEEERNIFCYGNPALDRFVNCREMPISEISNKLMIELNEKNYFVLIQHPTIVSVEKEYSLMVETLEAIKISGVNCLINSPNSDAGNFAISKAINEYANLYPNQFIQFKNLDRVTYINLLKKAKVLLGNSSSGLIEAPSVPLAVINIGIRQRGRAHADNVVFVDNDRYQIIDALKLIDTISFQERLKKVKNPYGDGNSAEKIVKILKSLIIDESLIYKNITY